MMMDYPPGRFNPLDPDERAGEEHPLDTDCTEYFPRPYVKFVHLAQVYMIDLLSRLQNTRYSKSYFLNLKQNNVNEATTMSKDHMRVLFYFVFAVGPSDNIPSRLKAATTRLLLERGDSLGRANRVFQSDWMADWTVLTPVGLVNLQLSGAFRITYHDEEKTDPKEVIHISGGRALFPPNMGNGRSTWELKDNMIDYDAMLIQLPSGVHIRLMPMVELARQIGGEVPADQMPLVPAMPLAHDEHPHDGEGA
jgi:hypothetical protein